MNLLNRPITVASTMREILEEYPGAQRALFRGYHIGGCSHCSFQPEETLEQVCQRNGRLDGNEILAHIRASHEQDAKILMEPKELAECLKGDTTIRLLDVRSREEFDAAHLEGSVLLTQPVMQKILAEGTNAGLLVIVDHLGKQGLDAAAYFMGHGLTNVRCLRGGIEAWSHDVDTTMKRYRLEL